MSNCAKGSKRSILAASAASALAIGLAAAPAGAVVINNNFTAGSIVDTTNITGVGQMVIDQRNGYLGLCTGTLINPRTVIFAAHCVNERSATAYGAATGGTPISFGFQADNRASVRAWYLSGTGQYKTNIANALYNVGQVRYNPLSLEPDAVDFLYGDVALATLDTPAANIPTWALMFSPLAQPASIGPSGTGYHVSITGYGTNGTAATGSTGGIDYRRRTADNMLGSLASLDDFEGFLFYGQTTAQGFTEGLPQNLYWIDFDDPRRGTASASRFDFNAWRDNATTKEGITASGDSGGPLILDQTFAKPVVIGVLSGGYSAFFNGQAPNSYGTASFYQPLYLYWDWIAANNPYHYVSAKAGNANWSDASHWVSNLDPNYQIIGPNGQIVNGVPTLTGEANTGTSGKFGQACFQDRTGSDCYDVRTGEETITTRPIGTATDGSAQVAAGDFLGAAAATDSGALSVPAATLGSDVGSADAATLTGTTGTTGTTAARAGLDPAIGTPTAQAAATALPAATLANGLPGATNFVPNNSDGVRATGVMARYFDVTLNAAGTTTLDSSATIDRLTLAGTGTGTGLTITSAGTLTSLMSVTQSAGVMTVNGRLVTGGDYGLVAGLLTGTGTIVTPYLTSVMGAIAPGGIGTIGTLTVQGNLVLSSGSQLSIDIGANRTSDRLAVNGAANLGGILGLNAVGGYRPTYNDTFSFITATGGISGRFGAASGFSGVLYPELAYSGTGVTARIAARSYLTVINGASPVQRAYAALLDANRGQYASYATLYGNLDVLNAGPLQPTLEAMAPITEATKRAIGRTATETLTRFYRDRTALVASGEVDGQLTLIGKPIQTAALQMDNTAGTMSDASTAGMAATPAAGVALPEGMSAFLAAGYLNGDTASLPRLSAPRDRIDGYWFAGGVEARVDDTGVAGLSLAWTHERGLPQAAQRAKGDLVMGTLYGSVQAPGGFTVAAQASAGTLRTRTRRSFTAGTQSYALRQSENSFVYRADATVSYKLGAPEFAIAPMAGVQTTIIDFNRARETGGDAALVTEMPNYRSVQLRAGAEASGEAVLGDIVVKPRLTGAYVHETQDQPGFFAANLVGGAGVGAAFLLPGTDRNWFEGGAAIRASSGGVFVDIASDTTWKRRDTSYQSFRVALGVQF